MIIIKILKIYGRRIIKDGSWSLIEVYFVYVVFMYIIVYGIKKKIVY